MKNILFIILIIGKCIAQSDTIPFDRTKEIVHDNKRYRVYNNWMSFGVGNAWSTIRNTDQINTGLDFNFHVQKEYFQVGGLMSGNNFGNNNNVQLHACYGKRLEAIKYNFSAFVGASYSLGGRPLSDTLKFDITKPYTTTGIYACIQAIYKIKYDVGIGGDLFVDYSKIQTLYGGRIVLYFSGAYRGFRKGYRPKK